MLSARWFANSIVSTSSGPNSSQRTLLPASIVASLLLGVVEIVGTLGPEGHMRFDSQWGARHTFHGLLSFDSIPGVATWLGIPVFDGASGLGYRMPNFDTTNHGSFVMIFREWLPAHFLSLAYMWLAIAICWSTFDLVGRSWNGRNSVVMRLWFTALIAVSVFAFLLHNNWSIALSGMLGVISTSVSLFHRGMFRGKPGATAAGMESAALAIGSLMLLAGSHPRYALTLVPVVVWRVAAVRNFVQQIRGNPMPILIATVSLVFVLAVLILELKSLGIPVSEVPKPRQNNFDFLIQDREFGDWRQFLRTLALNSALPLFLLTNWMGFTNWFSIQYEFVNFGVLIWLSIAFIVSRRDTSRVPEQKAALRSCSAAIVTILIWMMLTTESTSFPSVGQILFKADAYDLHFPAAALVIVAVIVSSSELSLESFTRSKLIKFGQLVGSVGIAVSLSFPFVALLTAPTLNGDQSWRDLSAGVLGDTELNTPPAGRLAAVILDGRCGEDVLRYRAVAGFGHATAISRNGIATIEGRPAYRELTGGVSAAGCYSLKLSRHTCDSFGLDFLSIGMVLERHSDTKCPWLASVETLAEYVEAGSSSPSGKLPPKYGNFYLSRDVPSLLSEGGCVVLSDCLDQTSRTIASQSQPPWRLCDERCWFRYDILSESAETGEWLLLPALFDPAVRARLVGGVGDLEIKPYRGLLAVRVSQSMTPRTLEVSIIPDLRMKMISTLPYASLVSFGAVGLLLRRGSRNRQPAREEVG